MMSATAAMQEAREQPVDKGVADIPICELLLKRTGRYACPPCSATDC